MNQRIVMPAPITLERVRTQNIFTSERYVGKKAVRVTQLKESSVFMWAGYVNQIGGVANG